MKVPAATMLALRMISHTAVDVAAVSSSTEPTSGLSVAARTFEYFPWCLRRGRLLDLFAPSGIASPLVPQIVPTSIGLLTVSRGAARAFARFCATGPILQRNAPHMHAMRQKYEKPGLPRVRLFWASLQDSISVLWILEY